MVDSTAGAGWEWQSFRWRLHVALWYAPTMADPVTAFARVFAPVLFANLCTVAFVWACVQYSKREQAGTEKEPGSGGYLSTIVTVCLFLLATLYIAFYG